MESVTVLHLTVYTSDGRSFKHSYDIPADEHASDRLFENTCKEFDEVGIRDGWIRLEYPYIAYRIEHIIAWEWDIISKDESAPATETIEHQMGFLSSRRR